MLNLKQVEKGLKAGGIKLDQLDRELGKAMDQDQAWAEEESKGSRAIGAKRFTELAGLRRAQAEILSEIERERSQVAEGLSNFRAYQNAIELRKLYDVAAAELRSSSEAVATLRACEERSRTALIAAEDLRRSQGKDEHNTNADIHRGGLHSIYHKLDHMIDELERLAYYFSPGGEWEETGGDLPKRLDHLFGGLSK